MQLTSFGDAWRVFLSLVRASEGKSGFQKMIGPVELMVVYFDDNRLSLEALSKFKAIPDGGLVSLLDMLVIQKNMSGDIALIELSNTADELERSEPEENGLGLFAQEDVDLVAEQLPNNSASALLLLEHTWLPRISDVSWREAAVTLLDEQVSPEIVARVEQLREEKRNG